MPSILARLVGAWASRQGWPATAADQGAQGAHDIRHGADGGPVQGLVVDALADSPHHVAGKLGAVGAISEMWMRPLLMVRLCF